MSHLSHASLASSIELIYQKITTGIPASSLSATELQDIDAVIEELNRGQLRVAEKKGAQWITHAWIKQAILLYLRLTPARTMQAGDFNFFDKIPVKKWSDSEKVRVVPPAFARRGAYIAPGAILMPSYVNIGAHVGTGTMVDTWATVGSCAQIGAHVHLSGGVGIGGVLEPIQANPVIVENHVFVGSRCIIVEGTHIEEGVVLGAGVTITASTKIIDVTKKEPTFYQGFVPQRSVVIPGTLPKEFPGGTFGVPCALIIGERKPSTDLKTSLNEALREYQVSV